MLPTTVRHRLCRGFLVLLLTTGHPVSLPDEMPQQDFTDALADAETLLLRSAEAGHEWLEAAALLEEARALEATGEHAAAWQALEKGRLQAEMALQQAEREAEAWGRRVLR